MDILNQINESLAFYSGWYHHPAMHTVKSCVGAILYGSRRASHLPLHAHQPIQHNREAAATCLLYILPATAFSSLFYLFPHL